MANHSTYAWRKAAQEFKAECYRQGIVICHLCGTEIPENAPRNSKMEFCADHLIPMELLDDPSDTSALAPSHRVCNTRRGLGPVRPMSPPQQALPAPVVPAAAPTIVAPQPKRAMVKSSMLCVDSAGLGGHPRIAQCRNAPGHHTLVAYVARAEAEQSRIAVYDHQR
ncbi:hypothetical protein GCM10007304_14780 [Rhodococcoides trifolii]|uniref:HNH endonuclease n=1 Tax=Rhodococcoides trifolii TaxID=908250 RepID=A0A917D0B8_9NOCA|nr:hypothetical protein GCM10007304_14780 [Rhodococcus trifolii]